MAPSIFLWALDLLGKNPDRTLIDGPAGVERLQAG
jgi:hypothetical protein